VKRSEIAFGLLRIPLDFLMTVAGLLIGYKLRLDWGVIPGLDLSTPTANLLPLDAYLEIILLFASFLVVVFAFFGLYQLTNTEGPLHESKKVAKHSLIWILVVMAYFFITRKLAFSRLVLGYGAIVTVILVILARLLLRKVEKWFLEANIGRRNVILIGSNKISERLGRALDQDPHYNLVGYLAERSGRMEAFKFLGNLTELAKIVRRHRVDSVILTTQNLSEVQDHDILEFCRQNHVEYRFVPDILEVERSNVDIEPLAGFPLIHLKPTPLDGWGRIVKRCFDILGSGLGLILLSPLFAIIALGIKLDSPGPVFFTKLEDGKPACRIGMDGKPFKFVKFRTMKHNTHHLRSELAKLNHRKGPLMKIKNDPRITKFGAFLRHTSLDELPNLWNVLKGDMSLVGPRPHLPEEVDRYEAKHQFLLTIKPGITGLGQVSGRSDLDFEEEARLDSFYIKHWSIFLDLKILFKTLRVVFSKKAAD
jgi:exopolysaccharide biosynthesis polyprenyl glycosylphosphotransferase